MFLSGKNIFFIELDKIFLFLFLFFYLLPINAIDEITSFDDYKDSIIVDSFRHSYSYTEQTSQYYSTTYTTSVVDFNAITTFSFFPMIDNDNHNMGYFSYRAAFQRKIVTYVGQINSFYFIDSSVKLNNNIFNPELAADKNFHNLIKGFAETNLILDSINVPEESDHYGARIFGITFLSLGGCSIIPGVFLSSILYQFLDYKGNIQKYKDYSTGAYAGIACIITGAIVAGIGLIFEMVDIFLYIPNGIYSSYIKKYDKKKDEIIKTLNKNILISGLNLTKDMKMKFALDLKFDK